MSPNCHAVTRGKKNFFRAKSIDLDRYHKVLLRCWEDAAREHGYSNSAEAIYQRYSIRVLGNRIVYDDERRYLLWQLRYADERRDSL
jgi:hypothetical protein